MELNAQMMILLSALGGTIVALASALGGVIRVLYLNGERRYQLIINDKDGQLSALSGELSSYKKIAMAQMEMIERDENERRRALGQPALRTAAAIEPDHNSPVTIEQQGIADVATLEERLKVIVDADQNRRRELPPIVRGPSPIAQVQTAVEANTSAIRDVEKSVEENTAALTNLAEKSV